MKRSLKLIFKAQQRKRADASENKGRPAERKLSTVKLCHLSIQPTTNTRGWLISPLGSNPWWTVLAAAIPALLCTILIFMDQQITAVIVNRKENKLKVRTTDKTVSR